MQSSEHSVATTARGHGRDRSAAAVQPEFSSPDRSPAAGNGVARTIRPAPPFLYRTVSLTVRPETLPEVIRALQAVAAHARCERGTRLCAWFQANEDPTRLLQVLVFDDDRAERVHGASAPARRLAQLLANGSAHADGPRQWHVLAGI